MYKLLPAVTIASNLLKSPWVEHASFNYVYHRAAIKCLNYQPSHHSEHWKFKCLSLENVLANLLNPGVQIWSTLFSIYCKRTPA